MAFCLRMLIVIVTARRKKMVVEGSQRNAVEIVDPVYEFPLLSSVSGPREGRSRWRYEEEREANAATLGFTSGSQMRQCGSPRRVRSGRGSCRHRRRTGSACSTRSERPRTGAPPPTAHNSPGTVSAGRCQSKTLLTASHPGDGIAEAVDDGTVGHARGACCFSKRDGHGVRRGAPVSVVVTLVSRRKPASVSHSASSCSRRGVPSA